MTYINENPEQDILGYMPVGYRGWPKSSTQNFAQEMLIAGSLKDPVYPSYGLNNSQNMGSTMNFGNTTPNSFVNLVSSPFSYGLEITGGSGPATTVVGDGTWINVTGTGSPYTVSFDTTGLCDYIEDNCTVPGFSDPYFNTVRDQGGDSYSGTTQPSAFGIVGDWVDGGGGGNDTGFIETDINGSNVEINYKRKMWERFYDGDAGEAFPTTSNDTFNFLGDGSYIGVTVASSGSCTTTLDINAVATATDQNVFSTIAADNGGNIVADTTTDTLTFAYDTDGGVYDNSIIITNDPATDTVKMKLDIDTLHRANPSVAMVFVVSADGFGSPPGFSASVTANKYAAAAYSPVWNGSEVTTAAVPCSLWDLGRSEGAGWVSDSSGLFEDTPAPATVTEALPLTGQWVMAFRLHPAYTDPTDGPILAAYVTSYFPRLKVQCATDTP